jgi:Fe-S oxidoreductase
MELCVSCKGCKRECPTGVDMARMKIEFLHHYHKRHGYSIKDRLVAYLPRYAPVASRLAPLFNLRDRIPGLARFTEYILGLSAKRSLPQWRRDTFFNALAASGRKDPVPGDGSGEVVLFVDCFNNYHEPENAHAALRVLEAAGYAVHIARAKNGSRPLCCGRTFLSGGMVDEAKQEAQRMLAALKLFVARGVPIVGLEPSCLYTLRDEYPVMLPGSQTAALAAQAMMFEEFLAKEQEAGSLKLALKSLPQKHALLHGHCHQKAFAGMPAVQKVLALVPGLEVKTVESSCCGMAGAFGYEAAHYDVSMKMAEAALLPAVRGANGDTLIVADGTSCRHQIHDGSQRQAIHVARVLEQALA